MRRFSLPFQQLKENPSLQKSIVKCLFAGNSQIDLTFLKSYQTSSSKHAKRFEKQSSHQVIRIQNWHEHKVLKQDNETRLIFVTIQNINALEVVAYIKSIHEENNLLLSAFTMTAIY